MPQATGSSRNVTDLAAPKYLWGFYLNFQHVCIFLSKYVRYRHFLLPREISMIIIKIMDQCVVLQNIKFPEDQIMTKELRSPKAIMMKVSCKSKLLLILSLMGIERKQALTNSVATYQVPESILACFNDDIISSPPVGIGATACLILTQPVVIKHNTSGSAEARRVNWEI